MIKVILFDCDGPIIKREKYFSQRLHEETGVVIDSQNEKSFFKGIFLQCETGKADLKQVLPEWPIPALFHLTPEVIRANRNKQGMYFHWVPGQILSSRNKKFCFAF